MQHFNLLPLRSLNAAPPVLKEGEEATGVRVLRRIQNLCAVPDSAQQYLFAKRQKSSLFPAHCPASEHTASGVNAPGRLCGAVEEATASLDCHSFRSASVNGMVRSISPLESKIRISPERKRARFCA
jgi:hypothetical protein